MRGFLSLLLLLLVPPAGVRNADRAVIVSPGDTCPSSDAIARHLQQLGALELLPQLGTALVRVEGPSLHLTFRDHQGDPLGNRVVTATADCEARAALAAAVIAAFVGEWAPQAPPVSAPAVKVEKNVPSKPRWQSDLGAMMSAVHDGDEGGFAIGVRADLGRGPWLASALVEGSSERERPLRSDQGGSGQGAYRFVRAGLGLGVRTLASRIFWDASLLPMVDRLSLVGKQLAASRTVTRWGLAVAGQTRLGWNGPHVRPFLFVGASYRAPGERMTLENRPAVKVSLSPFNVEAGLGIAFAISP
jgi:hypothetical protein